MAGKPTVTSDGTRKHIAGPGDVPVVQIPWYAPREQHTLVDFWLIVTRRKTAFIAGFLLSLGIGVAHALFSPKEFTVTSMITIGRVWAGGDLLKPVEEPITVLANIKEGYIPVIIDDYMTANPDAQRPRIQARRPTGSDLIILESTVREDNTDVYLELHQAVVGAIVDNHKTKVDSQREQFNQQIEASEVRLAEWSGLMQQAREPSADTNETRARQAPEPGVSDLRFNLMEDLIASMSERSDLETARLRKSRLSDTVAVVKPKRLNEEQGIGKFKVIAISLVVGVALGIMLALFGEFLAQVERRRQELAAAEPN